MTRMINRPGWLQALAFWSVVFGLAILVITVSAVVHFILTGRWLG